MNLPASKKYILHTTALQMHKDGEVVCGDCYNEIYDHSGNYTLVISDGMGSGETANSQAKATVDMTTCLTDIGTDAETTAELINSSLIIRSHKDCFATLDILSANLDNGNIQISKSGAAPTYIRTPSGTTRFECNTLPIGILPDIQPQYCKFTIDSEGIIIMMSDGISNTVLKSQHNKDWIHRYIENTDSIDTEDIANHILTTAIDKCDGKCSDDMTIVVVYIHKNE